jgi:MOSC domain-containing protein YiiM
MSSPPELRGTLLSVNVATVELLADRGRKVRTGIFKHPVAGPVRLDRLSVAGDIQVDRRYHGGPDQAIYLYPYEHYAHWRAALGREDLSPGFFGENFTTEGISEIVTRAGDIFRFGGATLQVTKPRLPCLKLGLRVGSPNFVREFLKSGRLGFYLRVLEEAEVAAGDAIERIASDPAQPTIAEVIERVGSR